MQIFLFIALVLSLITWLFSIFKSNLGKWDKAFAVFLFIYTLLNAYDLNFRKPIAPSPAKHATSLFT